MEKDRKLIRELKPGQSILIKDKWYSIEGVEVNKDLDEVHLRWGDGKDSGGILTTYDGTLTNQIK